MSGRYKSNSYVLAIDTTTPETGIGLSGGGVVRVKTWTSHRNQSKELLPNIDRLLRANKVKPEMLLGLVVNLGPGSFTGLRIGLSVANAFGYALNIPIAGRKNLTGDAQERIKTLLQTKITARKFKPAQAYYGRGPRITSPKPKTYR